MPGWISVSALVGKVASAFDLGSRPSTPARPVESDAAVLLDEVDRILVRAKDMLDNHKDLLPASEYASFSAQYRVLHTNLAEEETRQRNLSTRLAQKGRIPAQTNDTPAAAQSRALRLLNTAEEYKDKVVTASRRAHAAPTISFPDESPAAMTAPSPENAPSTSGVLPPVPSSSAPSTFDTPAPTPPRSDLPNQAPSASFPWSIRMPLIRTSVGLMTSGPGWTGSSSTTLSSEDSASIQHAQHTLFEDEDLLVAITHIRQGSKDSSTQSSVSTKGLYQRVVSVREGGRILDILDPRIYELTEDQLTIEDQAMAALHRAAERWRARRLANEID
ncbi:TPR-2 domain protein [Ceratobasidium sp. AG-Ba]|nr:TPR-2 domain protein [Ceratobasidium sp. AG-Ba]QRW03414.1 TPR-2 domain protein [Ceratobasidium sp. AG-Ba]